MKKTADRGRRSRASLLPLLSLLVSGCFAAGGAHANPVGPQVMHGQASFHSQGNVLSIANTPGAIIQWQGFSINPGEITRFLQQHADSAVLNRIVGQDPSRILGALQSNGRVFLINPNGILFGKGAQVDVHGLVASTLHLSNEDFLAGRMRFTLGDKAGAVQNQGEISTPAGGRVYLIAPQVGNSGIIASPKGDVVLAAGHSVHLVDAANPDLHVVVSAPDSEALNLGQIVAQGGKAGIFGALVKQRGLVVADSATVGDNGRIVFRASRDTVLDAGSRTSATGEGKGGEIRVLGADVSLRGDAAIDASGKAGGGTVLIGGDTQGKNLALQHALTATVSREASVRADATVQGDGGRVVVWSDGATRAFGSFSARGGAQGGAGGLVETSGRWLDVDRSRVDVGAQHGKAGTWLLDPEDIQIVSDTEVDIDFPGVSRIKASRFLHATGTVSLFADNDLEFTSDLRIDTPGVGLVAKAQRHLTVNGALSTNGGNIELVANYGNDVGVATVNNAIVSNNGKVSVAGNSVLVTGAGSVNAGTGGITLQTNPGGSIAVGGDGRLESGSAVWLAADRLDLRSADLQSGAAMPPRVKAPYVAIGPASNLLPIDIVGKTATTATTAAPERLELHAADLQTIQASTLAIGSRQDGMASGDLRVKTALDLSGKAGTLLLQAGCDSASAAGVSGLCATISQTDTSPITVNKLALLSQGDVALQAAANMVDTIAASIAGDSSNLRFRNGKALSVGVAAGIAGIQLHASGDYSAANPTGVIALRADGALTQEVNGLLNGKAVLAEGASVSLGADNATGVIAGKATGSGVTESGFRYSSANPILVADVDGQTGIITAGKAVELKTGQSIVVSHNIDTSAARGGNIYLSAGQNGDIVVQAPLIAVPAAAPTPTAGSPVTGLLTMDAGGAITADAGAGGAITADTLFASAGKGIAIKGSRLAHLSAVNSDTGGSPISVANLRPLKLLNVEQRGAGSTGGIVIDNIGALEAGGHSSADGIRSQRGDISLVAHSPLTINAPVSSADGGSIRLEAAASAAGNDILQINAPVATSGPVILIGPAGVNGAGNVTSPSIAIDAGAGTGAPPADPGPQLPTRDQCVANPMLSGCDTVLPSLHQCLKAPAAPGCSVVLPTMNQCVATPAALGCTAVLPTLDLCIATPNAPGCSVVLPAMSQCVATPYAPGCSAVLPSMNQCVATPSAPGCSVVLPTLGQCTVSPALPGCGVVLPTLSECTKTPALPGCSAVLPTLSQCTAAPATAGCSVILPSLGQCSVAPGLPGCSVVLPSVAQCVSSPVAPGCPAVLPTLAQCAAAPALPGCTVVLPSLGSCTATPGLAGCEAVLPGLAQCIAAPALAGCAAVLPTLNQCSETLTAPGCPVILPTPAQCAATPTLAGCNAVVPVLNTCAMDPSAPGCAVVLPVLPVPAAQVVTEPNPVVSQIRSAADTHLTTPLVTVMQYGAMPASGSAANSEPAGAKKAKGSDTAGPKESGAKIDETPKKMVCN